MDSLALWEKIEEARRKRYEEIEIEDNDGKKIRVNIGRIGWYGEYY